MARSTDVDELADLLDNAADMNELLETEINRLLAKKLGSWAEHHRIRKDQVPVKQLAQRMLRFKYAQPGSTFVVPKIDADQLTSYEQDALRTLAEQQNLDIHFARRGGGRRAYR